MFQEDSMRLEGIWPALATPLHEDETVDEAGMRRLVRRVLDGGVHGVVVLGSAGEFAALADGEKRRAIEIVVSEVAGQVPVIAGTGEPGTRRAVEQTRQAARLGADAAMVVPPYYYGQRADAVIRHYRALADGGELPLVLYNIPGCTKVMLEPDVVAELAGQESFIGIKDSSGNFGYFQTVAAEYKSERFGVVTGSDRFLFPSLLVGGDGSIGPTANVAPSWFVQLWDAVHAGRIEEAQAAQTKIVALGQMYRPGGFHQGLKGALSCLGICAPAVTAPMVALDAGQIEQVRSTLRELDLL
jgi:4-hydroxy-tetrahydrodipicolinate synthase